MCSYCRYGTLHLPAEFFNERGTMSLTTLLVFISLYTEMSSSLPKTSYVKHIDLWYMFSLTYLSLIITIHLATCTMALSNRMSKGAASAPKRRIRSITVVPGGPCGSQHEPKNCSTWDINILKISRVVFAVIAATFDIYYFMKV